MTASVHRLETGWSATVLGMGIPASAVGASVASTRRPRSLPVEIVHGGHEPGLGRSRMFELIDAYPTRRTRVAS